MKKAIFFLFALFAMGIIALVVVLNTKGVTFAPLSDGRVRTSQIFSQERLLKEGDKLVEQGLYVKALAKYEEGLEPRFISKEEDKRGPIVRKIRLFRVTGDFQAGLKEFGDAPKSLGLDPELRMQLGAVQSWSETGKKQPVYEYINHLKQKYGNSLPPKDYDSFSPIPIGDIILLYDTIGDHDAGIAFIDECVAYFKRQDIKKYGEYKPGKNDLEYQKVREAFEKDKAEGTKGRATKALIQSDYFPW